MMICNENIWSLQLPSTLLHFSQISIQTYFSPQKKTDIKYHHDTLNADYGYDSMNILFRNKRLDQHLLLESLRSVQNIFSILISKHPLITNVVVINLLLTLSSKTSHNEYLDLIEVCRAGKFLYDIIYFWLYVWMYYNHRDDNCWQ